MKISDLLENKPTSKIWWGPQTFNPSDDNIPQYFESEEDSEEVNDDTLKVLLTLNKPANNEDVERAAAYVFGGGHIVTMHADPKVRAALKAKFPSEPTDTMKAAGFEELESWTFAQLVASNADTRRWLSDDGFDGYMDYSVLYNEEPLQAIVFSPRQITAPKPIPRP